jgi:hypothetical protein
VRLLAAAAVLVGACGGDDAPAVCEQPRAALPSARPDQCGPAAEYTPINSYQGELVAVHDREDAVVMLGGDCTGTLVAAAAGAVVLTAGHCGRIDDRRLVSFNFEDAPDGDPLITEGTVIEQATAPDYALVQLDVLPAVTPTPLAIEPSDRLAIIQHPRGRPKAVAEGAFLDSCDDRLYYVDLDTDVGSSGAGVLDHDGFLVGIHTDGDCEDGGTNFGWTAASIVAASPHLQDADLAP